MRDLSAQEVEGVSGGIPPLLIAVASGLVRGGIAVGGFTGGYYGTKWILN